MSDAPKRKKRLLYIFLVPLIGIVVMQGVLLLSMIFFSGVKGTLENNAVETDMHILSNRQMALQNTMVGEWGTLSVESEEYSIVLNELLDERHMTVYDFLDDKDAQEAYHHLLSDRKEADIIYIAGSLYLIGQMKSLMRRIPDD